MVQRLRAPTALPKVLSSNPSNHMVVHYHLNEIRHPLLECLKIATVYLHIIINKSFLKNYMVVQTFKPSTQEAEAGGVLSSRPAWSTEVVPGQSRLYKETLTQKHYYYRI